MVICSMPISMFRIVAALVALGVLPVVAQVRPPAASGGLTIEKLIDIRHPSSPLWSRDSSKVAFLWERAGVSNLHVVPVDGSAKPVALTTDGQQVAGGFWSADNRSIYFTRGGTLMQVTVDGGQGPQPVWAQSPGRALAPSPDGRFVAYLAGGPVGGGRGAGRGGRGGRWCGGAAARATDTPQAPTPTEIHVRSLIDGTDRTVATFNGSVNAVSWTPDGEHLTFTSGGGGPDDSPRADAGLLRHEDHLHGERERPGARARRVSSLRPQGGSPEKFNTGNAGGGRGGDALARSDASAGRSAEPGFQASQHLRR